MVDTYQIVFLQFTSSMKPNFFSRFNPITVRDLITIQHNIIILGVTTAHFFQLLDFLLNIFFHKKQSICLRLFAEIQNHRKN